MVYRCPSAHNSPEIAEAVQSYHLLEPGVLPAAGGWVDQTEAFAAVVQILNAERAAIDRERDERSKNLRKAAGG